MRRVRAVLSAVCGMLAIIAGVTYAVGRVATDRTHITQYLFWTPSFLFLGALLLLVLATWVLSRRWTRRPVRVKRRGVWWWRISATALIAVTVHAAAVEWQVWRYVVPGSAAPAGKTIRVMHWNVTHAPPYRWDRYITAMSRAPKPDVLIISNRVNDRLLNDMADALGPEYTSASAGVFAIISRLPILERRAVSLEIPAEYTGRAGLPDASNPADDSPIMPKTEYLPKWSPVPRLGSNIFDPGQAVCVRIDATEQLGRELVIWALDLPSQPRAWRMQVAEAAAAKLYTEFSSDRFATPGIILGDMNTPRGSASLKLVSLGYPHAFEQAGRGHVATWPRRRAMFHIDHMYIAPGLRATSYETIDMGISEHRAQTAEITADAPP